MTVKGLKKMSDAGESRPQKRKRCILNCSVHV